MKQDLGVHKNLIKLLYTLRCMMTSIYYVFSTFIYISVIGCNFRVAEVLFMYMLQIVYATPETCVTSFLALKCKVDKPQKCP